jgi:hypothetical protein
MFMNLLILVLFSSTIYLYVNKYCINTSATQCTSDLTGSFINVVKYLGTILIKFIYAAIDIVKKNPYPKPQIPTKKD